MVFIRSLRVKEVTKSQFDTSVVSTPYFLQPLETMGAAERVSSQLEFPINKQKPQCNAVFYGVSQTF